MAGNASGDLAAALTRAKGRHIAVDAARAIGITTSVSAPVPTAMCLPVSTPPNAIAFSQGHLSAKDFIPGGLVVGLMAPFLCVWWARIIAS